MPTAHTRARAANRASTRPAERPARQSKLVLTKAATKASRQRAARPPRATVPEMCVQVKAAGTRRWQFIVSDAVLVSHVVRARDLSTRGTRAIRLAPQEAEQLAEDLNAEYAIRGTDGVYRPGAWDARVIAAPVP